MTPDGHGGGRSLRPRDVAPLGVFVREGFLDASAVARVRAAMTAGESEPAAVHDPGTETLALDPGARVAWEVALPDGLHDAVADRINGVLPAIERASGLALEPCDAVAALRYPPGAFYGPHQDVGDTPDEHGLHRRAVSIVIFLNDGDGAGAGFGGGRLRLYALMGTEDEGLDLVPEAGTLVAFPSRLRHEVTPVTWGERQALVTWLLAADGRAERRDASPGSEGVRQG